MAEVGQVVPAPGALGDAAPAARPRLVALVLLVLAAGGCFGSRMPPAPHTTSYSASYEARVAIASRGGTWSYTVRGRSTGDLIDAVSLAVPKECEVIAAPPWRGPTWEPTARKYTVVTYTPVSDVTITVDCPDRESHDRTFLVVGGPGRNPEYLLSLWGPEL